MENVKAEKHFFRDSGLSQWHRKLGWNAPACDLDCIVSVDGTVENGWVEYDSNTPVLLIDYKHENIGLIDFSQSSLRTLRKLADMARLPFLVIRYDSDFHWFDIFADNNFAIDALRAIANDPDNIVLHSGIRLTERQFVTVLYLLRHRVATAEFLSQFFDERI